MLAPIDGIAVDAYRNLAGDRELEAGRGDDDVGVEMLAGLQLDAALVETLDMIGDDRRLARLHRLEKIGVGDEAQPLIPRVVGRGERSEEHTSELQSLMRISYAVFCLKKKRTYIHHK